MELEFENLTKIYDKQRAVDGIDLKIEDGEFVVYYCDRPPFPNDLGDERLTRSILTTDVDEIKFKYVDLDDEDIEFIDNWEDRDYMPLGIWVRVVWNDGTHEDWLRRTAGSGYYERWGVWEQKFRQ